MLRFPSLCRRVLIGVILFIYLVLVWFPLHPSQSISIKLISVVRLEPLKTPCDCPHAPSSIIVSPTRGHIIQNTISVKKVKLNKTKMKTVTDIVNDPYPYVDFKLVFPSTVPIIKGSRNIFLIVLV